MWVFKTCARVRGKQSTLNQLRTTSRKKNGTGYSCSRWKSYTWRQFPILLLYLWSLFLLGFETCECTQDQSVFVDRFNFVCWLKICLPIFWKSFDRQEKCGSLEKVSIVFAIDWKSLDRFVIVWRSVDRFLDRLKKCRLFCWTSEKVAIFQKTFVERLFNFDPQT